MSSEPITNCAKFLEWVRAQKRGMLYRGLANADKWGDAESSIFRRLRDENNGADISRHHFIKATEHLLESAVMKGHDKKDGGKIGALELLAELQHYGAATCLIDFTKNPLIALWFACCEEFDSDGKVVAMDAGGNNAANIKSEHLTPDIAIGKLFHDSGNKIWTWEPRHQNKRITAQRSVFVFGEPEIKIPTKCYVGKKHKNDILKELEKYGISEESLFPDFDGFARKLNAHDKPVHMDEDGYLSIADDYRKNKNYDMADYYYTRVIGDE